MMKKLFAFIILMCFHVSHAAYVCPPAEIDVVDNGGGSYTFTANFDFSGTDFTIAYLSYINWNFSDGTSATGQLSVTHQFAQDGNYDVTFNFAFYKLLYAPVHNNSFCEGQSLAQSIIVTGVGGPEPESSIACPFAYFELYEITDFCFDGTVELNWSFCNVEDENSLPYWTADSVLWNMGDGSIQTTYGINSLTYSYESGVNNTSVSATAYFSSNDGVHCETPVYFTDNESPCDAYEADTLSFFTPNLPVVVLSANPNLYLSATSACSNELIDFSAYPEFIPDSLSESFWSYVLIIDGDTIYSDDGLPAPNTPFYQSYLDSGQHTIELAFHFEWGFNDRFCDVYSTQLITIESCDTCASCTTFKPAPGERYWVSAWVKESQVTQVKTYENTYLEFGFTGSGQPNSEFYPSGRIVEGWQRIVGSFTIPDNTTELDIKLVNDDLSVDAYFDDIRIHPFNASMKSYVYDPETLWLVAELDGNNYATFYEYDAEGQLVRIEKETARGVVTIQESRSSNPKTE